jgi:acetyl-CoA synthase
MGLEADPIKHAHLMIAHIDKKRKELGIDKARERVSSWIWPIVRNWKLRNNRKFLNEGGTKCLDLLHLPPFRVVITFVSKVEGKLERRLETFNADTKVGFPNTAYFLPVIYSLTGIKVETLEDMKKPLAVRPQTAAAACQGQQPSALPGAPAGCRHGRDLFAFEIEEALRYLNDPDFYLPTEEDRPGSRQDLARCCRRYGHAEARRGVRRRLGARICRHRRRCPHIRKLPRMIVEEYQKKASTSSAPPTRTAPTVIEQLIEAGVQVGWNTRIVPFGPDISSAIFALGFANRAAMALVACSPATTIKS